MLARPGQQSLVRIYDPTGQVKDEVTSGDIVPASIEVSGAFADWALSFHFTPDGARKIHLLTQALAQRGAQVHVPQAFAFAVGGHVYARPTVDYENSPDGLSGRAGLQILGLRCDVAQRLAVQMRKPLFTPEQIGCVQGARPKPARRGTAVVVVAGSSHTCALTAAGGVDCWGTNHFGELGDGTAEGAFVPNPSPVSVTGLTGGIRTISSGSDHTCVLMKRGTVSCWGLNQFGELGEGDLVNRNAPVAVRGLKGIRAITAGDGQTCALTSSKAVWCWGLNIQGQLGDGTTVNRSRPVRVHGLGPVRSIDAGGVHTCAVTTVGAVRCWGFNEFGQLGDGTTVDRHTPVPVAGLAAGVRMIAAGGLHTCALTTGGRVLCWGGNSQGQLGDGTTKKRLTPVAVSGLRDVTAIAAGDSYACALTSTRKVECWGYNPNGQLGDGTTRTRLTPVVVAGLGGVRAIAAGGSHACALLASGGLECWGANQYGQLGDGTIHDRHAPVAVAGFGPERH